MDRAKTELQFFLGSAFCLFVLCFSGQYVVADPGHTFPSVPGTGAWCWFQDPRAIYYKGTKEKVYVALTAADGTNKVWSYDLETGDTAISNLYTANRIDDHNVPSLHLHDDGRITAFYTRHGMDALVRYRTTQNPEDISSWQPEKTLALPDAQFGSSYSHTFQLEDESDRIYLFTRNINWGPTMFYTDDKGETWSNGVEVVSSSDRPYTKYVSDEKSKIHFAYTDGHPRVQPNNSIYYMYMEGGKFYTIDGTFIKDVADLPVETSPNYEADRVYDGSTDGRSWVWDIALDSSGYPVIVFVVFPDNNNHHYYYSRWTGTEWFVTELTNGGKWFPQTPNGGSEPEPNYSPGLSLDHNDPSIVYLSRFISGETEIERWVTPDKGDTWSSTPITSGSSTRNARPIVPWTVPFEADPPSKEMVFWMEGEYIEYTNYSGTIRYHMWEDTSTTPIIQNTEKVNFTIKTLQNGIVLDGLSEIITGQNGSIYLSLQTPSGKKLYEEKIPIQKNEEPYFLFPTNFGHETENTGTQLYIVSVSIKAVSGATIGKVHRPVVFVK